MSKREQNKQENRLAITNAARKIFAVKGVESCIVTDIIGRSGLAAGTFYKYFKSKEEVFEEISYNIAGDIVQILEDGFRQEAHPKAYIQAILGKFESYFLKDPVALGFVIRNYAVLNDSFAENNAWQQVNSRLDDHLKVAHQAGLLPFQDPVLMVKVLVAGTSAIFAHIESDCKSLSERKKAFEFLKIFLTNSVRIET